MKTTGEKAKTTLRCRIELPEPFRPNEVLSFHQRDARMVAERVETRTLHKGLSWGDCPARLTIRFNNRFASAELVIDGAGPGDAAEVSRMVRRMLSLTEPVEEFEEIYHDHSQIGPLIAKNPGLRAPLTATPFEALTWAITGQQITVGAATSIRRKFIHLLRSPLALTRPLSAALTLPSLRLIAIVWTSLTSLAARLGAALMMVYFRILTAIDVATDAKAEVIKGGVG